MEYPASWSLDSEASGFEKMESGINGRAIDFAKFGRLFLNRGKWWGRRRGASAYDFFARGMYGQRIYVSPQKNAIIVRFGVEYGQLDSWQDVLQNVADKLN
jgi:CubicO group peptidase (beta-lactamase class C family)